MAARLAALRVASPVGGSSGDGTFSPWVLGGLFDAYADPLDPQTIGPEGLFELCSDVGWATGSIEVLALAWAVSATSMGYLAQAEWMSLHAHRIDSLDALRRFVAVLVDRLAANIDVRHDLYRYAFDYAVVPGRRTVPMDQAVDLWLLLLSDIGSTHHLRCFLDYVSSPACSYRVVSKDQWLMFFDFYELISSADNIADVYSPEAAWPVLFDEYVAWLAS